METQLYLSDLRAHEVRCSEGANGTFRIEGLPLLKPGTYHGIEFSSERLDSIAQNFAKSSEQLGFYPPLRPFHVKPGDRVDARTDILGNVTAVRMEDGVLLGDAVVYEPETVRRMQNGQYRYTSSEVRLNPATVDGQDALVGVAYVDDPAVKGMPWQLVMNRNEYAVIQGGDEPPAPPEGRSERNMTLSERVRAAFGMLQEAQAELDAPPEQTIETPEMVALRERAEAAEVALQAERDRAAEAATERTRAMVDGHVTALLSERYIVPAQQDSLRAIMLALGAAPQTVVLSEGAEPVGLVDALVASLRTGQQIDEKYFSRQSTPAMDTQKTVEQYAAEIIAAGKTS